MDLIDIVRYFGALALVLALVGVAAIAVKRYGLPGVVGGKGRRIAVLESAMLGKNHRLVIVACDGIEHLLAVGPQATTVLSSKPAQPAAPAFATALAEAKAEHKTDEAA